MKIKVIVKCVYSFTFETREKDRHKIQDEAETKWDAIMAIGKEDEKFEDTEIEWHENN